MLQHGLNLENIILSEISQTQKKGQICDHTLDEISRKWAFIRDRE